MLFVINSISSTRKYISFQKPNEAFNPLNCHRDIAPWKFKLYMILNPEVNTMALADHAPSYNKL